MRLRCLLAVAVTSLFTAMNLHAAPLASLYDYKVNSLDGQPVDLSIYKGDVALVVNVASRCGNTPQYAGLEKLYTDYKDKGFVILGFPSNDFGHQEPGTPQEITTFCTHEVPRDLPHVREGRDQGRGPGAGL